jgi:hypothetical protein
MRSVAQPHNSMTQHANTGHRMNILIMANPFIDEWL